LNKLKQKPMELLMKLKLRRTKKKSLNNNQNKLKTQLKFKLRKNLREKVERSDRIVKKPKKNQLSKKLRNNLLKVLLGLKITKRKKLCQLKGPKTLRLELNNNGYQKKLFKRIIMSKKTLSQLNKMKN
jgi:hypothetical protein